MLPCKLTDLVYKVLIKCMKVRMVYQHLLTIARSHLIDEKWKLMACLWASQKYVHSHSWLTCEDELKSSPASPDFISSMVVLWDVRPPQQHSPESYLVAFVRRQEFFLCNGSSFTDSLMCPPALLLLLKHEVQTDLKQGGTGLLHCERILCYS